MLILSDYGNASNSSLELNQTINTATGSAAAGVGISAAPFVQLSPGVFYGSPGYSGNDQNLHQVPCPGQDQGQDQSQGQSQDPFWTHFLDEQNIKVIITSAPTIRSIKTWQTKIKPYHANILTLIIDPDFDLSKYHDEELTMINEFQSIQSKLLDTINGHFNYNTKISIPFITSSDLLISLTIVTNFLKNFNIHYPNLGILIMYNGYNSKLSTVLAISHLISISPMKNITTLLNNLHISSPHLTDLRILETGYIDDVLTKFWEIHYLGFKSQQEQQDLQMIGMGLGQGYGHDNNGNYISSVGSGFGSGTGSGTDKRGMNTSNNNDNDTNVLKRKKI